MCNLKFFSVGIAFLALSFFGVNFAEAAITIDAPPIDKFFQSPTVGGGAILPITSFRLVQSSGTDALTKVGVQLFASSTISQGEISRISLWKESGATPGFQIGQDTFIAGAASSSPMADGTLIVLTPTTPVSIGSTPSEFFIVASTTAVSGITNGHGFDLRMQNNFASTTAGGIGSAFNSGRKITLNQSAPLKISEVKAGATGNAADEFVELYNTGETDINLADLPLNLHTFYSSPNGSSTPVALTYYKRIIPGHGFFLIGNPIGYSGTTPLDAVFATSTFSVLNSNSGVSIATSSGIAATSTAIDRIAWGAQALTNGEGPSLPPDLPNDKSYERKATTTSTDISMAPGGMDATKGNGTDNNDNRLDNDGNSIDAGDFVQQSGAGINPQNSNSPVEFPFGGGGMPDTSSPQVMGSYPSNGMTGVPIDFTFIGFGFNKPMSTSTINTTNVSLTTAASGATNLCSNVTYNPFPSNFEPPAKCSISGSLTPGATYVFTVGTGVLDMSNNPLDQNSFTVGNQPYVATFTAGAAGQTFANTMPPSVIGVSPFQGSMNIPTNLAKISIEFSSDMNVSTLNNANITLTAGATNVPLSNFSFSTSTGRNLLSATVASLPLSSNTVYTVKVNTSVQNSNRIPLPAQYMSTFTTSSQADNSAPVIVGVLPTANATITANTNDFVFTFDDNIDASTATSGAVTLAIAGGSNLPGAVMYSPIAKEGHFIPNNVLPVGQNLILTLKGGSITNVSGIALGADVTKNYTVEAANSDITPPSILFANGNEFNLAITFSEAVNSTDATTLANYSLTVGGMAQTLSSMAGNTLTYDAQTRTVKLTGVHFTPSSSFSVTAQNIKDISGNTMTSSSFNGTISSASSQGFVGPGSFTGSTFGDQKDFSSSGIGFMPPVEIRPSSNFINASSTYNFNLPIAKQIDAGGTIVITFPSTADFSICCAATTSSNNPFMTSQNSDINGPGAGIIGIKTITGDAIAKTITLTLDTATRSELFNGLTDTHDFLNFALAGIKNPSIPKGIDTSGYSIDIKSKKADGTLLESFSANPIYIGGGSSGGGATTTITGKATGNGGNLANMKIHMMSQQTGLLDATTDNTGIYQFTNIPVGSQMLSNNFGGGNQFFLFTDPIISGINDSNGATTTAFFGDSMPTPIQATSTSVITRNFALTATSSAINFNVKVTASSGTFGAAEQVDIFAGGPGKFVTRTVTPGSGSLTNSILTTIPIPQVNGHWGLGIGPAMPKGAGDMMMTSMPQVSWSVPKPIDVTVSGCPSACIATVSNVATTSNGFIISKADKTIAGLLQDASGNSISGAMVAAYSPTGGTGNQAQTSASGSFSVGVTQGSYVVSAFSPGVGQSREIDVVVDSSGNVFVNGSPTASTGASGVNPFIVKMTKPGNKITGRVTDGANPVGGASVYAYRTDGPGHGDAITDSSTGNYTIYADNGSWKVGAFVPGFGPMTEQTVTVAGADKTGIDFAPVSGTTFSVLSGTIYEDLNNDNIYATGTEAISGAIIRVSGSGGTNEGVSGNDGSFSIRVPSGNGYSIADIFHPSYGRIAPLNSAGNAIGTLNLTASTTQYIRVPVRRTVTVNFKDSNGNLLIVPKASIDLFDTVRQSGVHAEITNASSTTMLVPDKASSTIRAFIQGVPASNISIAAVDGNTLILNGVLEVNGNEGVNITVNTAAKPMVTVSGTVYKTAATGGNELADAWIEFIDSSNGVRVGTQASSAGTYSLSLAKGTYNITAMKPGFVGTPSSVAFNGDTVQNFVLNQSNLIISGQVTAGGSVAKDAFVRAQKAGGGEVVGKTDTSGNYSLNVTSGTWRVFATAEGYSQAGYSSNPIEITTASQNNINIALTSAVSLQTKLATSNTFTDTSAGTFNDSTVGVNIQLDSGTLGTAGSSAYLTARETSNIPNTASVSIVGNKAKDISAYSGGSQVKNLQSGKSATVDLTYSKSELNSSGITTTDGVSKLNMVSYSDDKQEWESLPTTITYKDSSNAPIASPSSDLTGVATVVFTAVGTHFSPYALSQASGINPPDVPVGIDAASSGSKQIAVNWSSVSGATGYYIYRDTSSTGSFPLLADAGNTTSYTDTGLTNGTTYYYKISAYKNTGSPESAASSPVNATASGVSGGGGTSGGGSTSVQTSSSSSAPSSSSSSVSSTSASVVQTANSASIVANPSSVARTVSPAFNRNLSRGSRGEDVRNLQKLLAQDKTIYPEGLVTGVFGPATEKAVKKFQIKYNLPPVGAIGPLTRQILQIVANASPSIAAETSSQSSSVSVQSANSLSSSGTVSKHLQKGMKDNQVSTLQQWLSQDKDIYPDAIVSGYFGPLTEKAVEKFQDKYGIVKSGEEG
ncbi:peptidoglycan-binding protein, partial [Patescibacteria group bacterium]|nr:peptidoglycan-binding protein [Patescibacteria group bacterium]